MENEIQELKSGLRRETFYTAIGYLASFCVGLISVPLIIKYTSIEIYGAYILCLVITGWVGNLDLRIMHGVLQNASASRAKGELEKISADIQICLIYFIGFFLFISLPLALLAEKIIPKILFTQQAEIPSIFALAVIALPLGRAASCLYSVVRAFQMTYVITRLSIIGFILSIIGLWLVLKLGFGIPGVIVLGIIGVFGQIILASRIISRKGIKIRLLGKVDFINRLHKLISFGSKLMLCDIINSITSLDRFFVNFVTKGLSSVALYQFSLSITGRAWQIALLPISTLIPAAGYVWGSGNKERLEFLTLRFTKYLALFGSAILLFIGIMAEELLSAWLALGKNEAGESALYLRILIIGFLTNMIATTPAQIGFAIGKPGIQVKAEIYGMLITIILFIAVFSKIGILGIPIAIAFYTGFHGILYIILFKRAFPLSTLNLLKAYLLPLAISVFALIGPACVKYIIFSNKFPQGRLSAIKVLVITSIIYFTVVILTSILSGLVSKKEFRDIIGKKD